ncbi:MAG: hypothetical protein WEA99_13000 [Brumimicrobium sp.]
MQTSEINISKVIEEGKLKTYFFGASFIEVYWLYHKLSPGHCYLFLFSTGNQQLVEVKTVSPKRFPVKQRAKQMNSVVLRMMEGLRKDLDR